MELPQINVSSEGVSVTSQFSGLNRNPVVPDGQWADMRNITNDNYPLLTNRKSRGYIKQFDNIQGVCSGSAFAIVDDNKLYYDNNYITDLEVSDKNREIVRMGANICVFPDGFIYNTADSTTKYIRNITTGTGVTITLCKLDGTKFTSSNSVVSSSEPQDTTKYWIDTSQDTVVVKVYSSSTSMWISVGTTYVIFEGEDIGLGFKAGDAVTFSGVDTGDWCYNGYDFNQSNLIADAGDDYLITVGLINLNHTNSTQIVFERKLPKIDYVCEFGNRLYACYCGYNEDGESVNEIYASKLGDPTNWNCYAGLDSDSYAASVGTEGDFTGICSYGGYVFFFKQNGFHKLYGTKPSNFELVWKEGRGVQKGCSKSVQIVNDVMYFKAIDGVYAYNGALENIGLALGSKSYSDAVGGMYRNKYYLCMTGADEKRMLFVYDTTKAMWTIEDEIDIKYIALSDMCLLFFDSSNNMYCVNSDKLFSVIYPQEPFGYTFDWKNDFTYSDLYIVSNVETVTTTSLEITANIIGKWTLSRNLVHVISRIIFGTDTPLEINAYKFPEDENLVTIECYDSNDTLIYTTNSVVKPGYGGLYMEETVTLVDGSMLNPGMPTSQTSYVKIKVGYEDQSPFSYEYRTITQATSENEINGLLGTISDWITEDMIYCSDGMNVKLIKSSATIRAEKETRWYWQNPTVFIATEGSTAGTYLSPAYTYPGNWAPEYAATGNVEETFEWRFETGDIDLGSPYQKYLKRIIVRVWLDTSSKMKIEVNYDSSDDWEEAVELYATKKRSYEIPIPVARCDHMRIRFSGWGEFKLYSIAKIVEEGSGTR